MQGAIILTALVGSLQVVLFASLRNSFWQVSLLVVVLCLLLFPAMGLKRAFSMFLTGCFLFVAIVCVHMAAMAANFGSEAGFHFPMIVGFALIMVSARIGIESKVVLSIALLALFVLIDRAYAAIPISQTLGPVVGGAVRAFNLGVVAIALAMLVYRYFDTVNFQYLELRRLAETDSLTGLLNRRRLMDIGVDIASKRDRQASHASIVICDIDHFKHINDRYGHEAGDAAIRYAATLLSAEIGASGHVGRWGGEEFLVILDDVKAQEALEVAERLRRAIGDSVLTIGAVRLRITMTAGVATLLPGESFSDGLARADAALYVGKSTGRDRVVDADPHADMMACDIGEHVVGSRRNESD